MLVTKKNTVAVELWQRTTCSLFKQFVLAEYVFDEADRSLAIATSVLEYEPHLRLRLTINLKLPAIESKTYFTLQVYRLKVLERCTTNCRFAVEPSDDRSRVGCGLPIA